MGQNLVPEQQEKSGFATDSARPAAVVSGRLSMWRTRKPKVVKQRSAMQPAGPAPTMTTLRVDNVSFEAACTAGTPARTRTRRRERQRCLRARWRMRSPT